MAITSSTYTLDDHTQADGRTFIYESHAGSDGVVYPVSYLAAVGTNYTAVMNARAVQLSEQLAQEEFERLLAA